MKLKTHETIIFWVKAIMFTAFALNIVRVCVKTWKYGGAKSRTVVSYDNDTENDPDNNAEDEL